MKKYLVLLSILAVLGSSAKAEQPKTATAPAAAPAKTEVAKAEVAKPDSSLQSAATPAPKKRQSLNLDERPNEIIRDNVSYSGIAVQLVKTDNPVQLINPAAPARYGSPEDNTLRNPIDGKVLGLKIFSVRF